MNLAKLFEVQKALDREIERKHPRVPDEDRLEKRVLALLVELGECANEWRGFKFWSTDQEPRVQVVDQYEITTHTVKAEENYMISGTRITNVHLPKTWKNPLLEEYVDCVHFALSIGLQLNIPLNLEWEPYRKKTVTEQFTGLLQADWETYYPNVYHGYCRNMELLIGLGEMLGFTWNQVESAYMEKNQVNHDRQANGY